MQCYAPCSDEAAGLSSTEYRVPAQDHYVYREEAVRKHLFWSPEEEDAERRRAAQPPRAMAPRSMSTSMVPQSLNLSGLFPSRQTQSQPFSSVYGQGGVHFPPCGDERADPRCRHDVIMMTPPPSGRFPFCENYSDAASAFPRPDTPPPTWWLPGCGETPVAEPDLVWAGPEEATPSRFRPERKRSDSADGRRRDALAAGGPVAQERQAPQGGGRDSNCCMPSRRRPGDEDGGERGCGDGIAKGISECLDPVELRSPDASPRAAGRREAAPGRRRPLVASRPALSP